MQESVEGVEQLESYFGQYVPQFFYAFIAPITLFVLFGLAGSFKVAGVLLVCVPLIPGAIMMVQKIAKRILSKYWDQYAKLGSYLALPVHSFMMLHSCSLMSQPAILIRLAAHTRDFSHELAALS